jgi:hypothetical protein
MTPADSSLWVGPCTQQDAGMARVLEWLHKATGNTHAVASELPLLYSNACDMQHQLNCCHRLTVALTLCSVSL